MLFTPVPDRTDKFMLVLSLAAGTLGAPTASLLVCEFASDGLPGFAVLYAALFVFSLWLQRVAIGLYAGQWLVDHRYKLYLLTDCAIIGLPLLVMHGFGLACAVVGFMLVYAALWRLCVS